MIRCAWGFTALFAAMALASAAAAQDRLPPGPPVGGGDRVTIGFGLGAAPDYEGSNDYQLQPGGVVQGRLRGIDFQMRGLNLYTNVMPDRRDDRVRLVLGPVLQLRPERTDRVDDPRVAALGTRKTAFELGLTAGVALRGVLIPPATLTAEVTWLRDVAGAHDSFSLTPSLALSSPVSRRSFARLSVSAEYVGRGFARTYFDVAPGGGLPPFATTGGGWKSAGANLLYTRDLGGDPRRGMGLFAITSYKRMLGQFAASPVVRDAGSANQAFAVAGLSYSF